MSRSKGQTIVVVRFGALKSFQYLVGDEETLRPSGRGAGVVV